MIALKSHRFVFVVCGGAALALAVGPAFAHAKLLSETPVAEDAGAARAAAGPVTELRLNFSEALNLAFSKVGVTDANDPAVSTASVAFDPKDGKVLIVTFASPLPKGEYAVSWTAVATDGHKTNGTYKINVAQ